MTSLTAASLRHQSRQFLAPGLAVVLGVAFVAATLVLTGTMNASFREAVAGQYSSYSAVVTPPKGEETLPAGVADRVSHADGVANVDPVRTGSGMIGSSTDASPAMINTESSLVPHPVIDGRAPRGPDEVALSESVRAGTGLEVGDTVPVQPTDGDGGGTRAKVVGVLDVSDDPRYGGGTPAVFATPKGVTDMTGDTGWDEIPVVGTDGDEAGTASNISSALQAKGADVQVQTATEHADAKVAEFTGGSDFLAAFFLAFAIIALFVSMIVIGNTFSILLARRARETALLRTVGATRGQVVRASVLEALVVGLVSSVVGVGVGVGLAWALVEGGSALAGDALPDLVLAVPARAVVVPVLVGVLVVLVAGLRPAVRSSRVSPLAALRPDAAVTAGSRRGRVRIASGVLLTLLGAGSLIGAGVGDSVGASVGLGVIGGLLSFTGILLIGTVLVPWVVRLVGLVAARPFGSTGRLAIENAVRNPARAASTASALLVGVTLVTMTAVGAATTRTVMTDFLDSQYPVDVVLQGSDIPSSTVDAVGDVDGVAATAELTGTQAQVRGSGSAPKEATPVAAVPGDVDEVVRDASVMPRPDAGTVVVAEEAADAAGLSDGDEVRLRGSDGSAPVTVQVEGGFDTAWLVSPGTLERLDSEPATTATLARLADGADAQTSVDRIKEMGSGLEEGSVGGGALVRQTNMQALDMALAVVLALLAVSVLIAVVGIANTLSLSVIERTRESALMRALGLTRGQLRLMLGIEAVLLALAGVLVGTVLGVVYGVTGVSALFGDFVTVTPTLPWGQLAAVALVALLAGVLASVLPSRRAARVAPARALAAE